MQSQFDYQIYATKKNWFELHLSRSFFLKNRRLFLMNDSLINKYDIDEFKSE